MRIKIPRDDECELLSPKVQRAVQDSPLRHAFETSDERGPSRIVVFDYDENAPYWRDLYRNWNKQSSPNVQYCYNLKRLEQYGICETESEWYNFGFCSMSCGVPCQGQSWEHYWEMTADYYEDLINPENNGDEAFGKLHCESFICVESSGIF